MNGKLSVLFIISVCCLNEVSSCTLGSLFAPNSFAILDFPPTANNENYILPQISGYFKDLVTVTSYQMNLYDQAGNLKSWTFQAGNVYPPGQLSKFGGYIQVENNFPQSFVGEIVLYNHQNVVSCYGYSFRVFNIS